MTSQNKSQYFWSERKTVHFKCVHLLKLNFVIFKSTLAYRWFQKLKATKETILCSWLLAALLNVYCAACRESIIVFCGLLNTFNWQDSVCPAREIFIKNNSKNKYYFNTFHNNYLVSSVLWFF